MTKKKATAYKDFFEKAKLAPEIGTGENRTETLRRSTLQGPKPTPPGQPKWVDSI